MRVCFCVHRLPYPPIAGGKTETYKLIEGLSKQGHDVDVISYCDDLDRAREMERESGCTIVPVPGLPNRTWGNVLKNVISPDPLPVMKARTERYQDEVSDRADDADVLHLHALQTAYLASSLDVDVPTVLRFNNVKYEIYRQYAKHTGNPAKSLYAYLQYAKTKGFETRIPERSDLTLTITEEDRERLTRRDTSANIDVLPAGVDLSRFRPDNGEPEERTITFFGSMDYHPNEDAAIWFTEEVLPRVRAQFDDATFEIVGKSPPASVRALAKRDGVRVTGFVEDIQEYVSRATIVVIPIRVGTGVRIKVLHAMAMGKPMVSTPVGVQGIRVEEDRHAVVAQTPDEFAAAVEALLTDPERRGRLGRNARTLVKSDHDWATIVERLGAFYDGL